jgi:hypothetical protein
MLSGTPYKLCQGFPDNPPWRQGNDYGGAGSDRPFSIAPRQALPPHAPNGPVRPAPGFSIAAAYSCEPGYNITGGGPMEVQNNPAGRLYDLLEAARQYPSEEKTKTVGPTFSASRKTTPATY